MTETAIVVVNAGSSSIKFVVFADREGALDPVVRGQIEALFTAPRFVARDARGRVQEEKSCAAASSSVAISAPPAAHLQQGRAEGLELAAVGHRVVHGGTQYSAPVRVDAGVLGALEKLSCRSRRCTSRTTSLRSARSLPRGRAAAGRLLRHRVPPHAAAACAGFCAAGGDYRGWGAALRLPRTFLRLHRLGA